MGVTPIVDRPLLAVHGLERLTPPSGLEPEAESVVQSTDRAGPCARATRF